MFQQLFLFRTIFEKAERRFEYEAKQALSGIYTRLCIITTCFLLPPCRANKRFEGHNQGSQNTKCGALWRELCPFDKGQQLCQWLAKTGERVGRDSKDSVCTEKRCFHVVTVMDPDSKQLQSASGYDAYRKTIHIKKGRSLSLYVDTDPADANVQFLNISSAFYQGIELDSGRYHVEVSASRYETKKLV